MVFYELIPNIKNDNYFDFIERNDDRSFFRFMSMGINPSKQTRNQLPSSPPLWSPSAPELPAMVPRPDLRTA